MDVGYREKLEGGKLMLIEEVREILDCFDDGTIDFYYEAFQIYTDDLTAYVEPDYVEIWMKGNKERFIYKDGEWED